MKILYAILSCENYLQSRCNVVRDTWGTKISEDCKMVFISGKNPNNLKDVFATNTPDQYYATAIKLGVFIKEYDFKNFDWVFICDDDTMAFPSRIRKMLEYYQEKYSTIPTCIGRQGYTEDNLLTDSPLSYPVIFPSGGAGFAINKLMLLEIQHFLIQYNYVPHSWNSDVSFGLWMKALSSQTIFIDRTDVLKSQNPKHEENRGVSPLDVCTFHYCNESDFYTLNQFH